MFLPGYRLQLRVLDTLQRSQRVPANIRLRCAGRGFNQKWDQSQVPTRPPAGTWVYIVWCFSPPKNGFVLKNQIFSTSTM